MPLTTDKSRRFFLQSSLVGGLAFSATALKGFNDTHAEEKSYIPGTPLNILLGNKLEKEFEQSLRGISSGIQLLKSSDEAALAQADVYFGRIPEADFRKTKNLKWVHSSSAGVEHQLYPSFKESPVILSNAKGCYGPAIAEHTIGLLFTLTRKIGSQVRNMRTHQWKGEDDQMEMKDLTMGIVGFGGIGRQTARRAKAFDMKILATDIQPFYDVQIGDLCDEMFYVYDGGLEQVLKRSDVVVSAAPHTPKSEGMFGREQFALMKNGTYFINVSRGKLVKTSELVEALKNGHLAGAGLDVTDPEPLPEDHELWDMPNVVITSHISGRSQHSWRRSQSVFVENVNRFYHGYPLLNLVDKEAGF
jgi:phosphoglycerate dehydrogenase-like enzyme